MSTRRKESAKRSNDSKADACSNRRSVSMSEEDVVLERIPWRHSVKFPSSLKKMPNAPSVARIPTNEEVDAAISKGCARSAQAAKAVRNPRSK